ncbi:MAG TPA: hypothetical protein VK588_12895 [Chitinophagaceae bacterium]|nr:hypothetical protein [Chitinophagaceae bacterium]
MKKIFTLILAAGLISTAAFAQDRRHSNDNRTYSNSYQTQYPVNNGYNSYNSRSNSGRFEQNWSYNRHDRDRDRRIVARRFRRYSRANIYRPKEGLSFQITIGSHRKY